MNSGRKEEMKERKTLDVYAKGMKKACMDRFSHKNT